MSITICRTKFGPLIEWPEPAGVDLAIMSILPSGGGRVLKTLLLPHQTYVHTAEWCFAHSAKVERVEIIPVRHAEIVSFTRDELRAELARMQANEALARLPWGVRMARAA